MNKDDYKRQPDYAEAQIKSFITDLSKGYDQQLRAIKKFQDWVIVSKPEVYDDDADLLFRGGKVDRGNVKGLLYWTGVMSSKHTGKLKRICPAALALLHLIVDMTYDEGEDNIFYARYICTPLSQLRKINFDRHVLSKSGGEEVLLAVQLVGVLVNDHRTEEGSIDPLEGPDLLSDNEAQEIFNQWVQSTGAVQITEEVQQFKIQKEKIALVEHRPKTWADVVFLTVPLQEGEDGADEIDKDKVVEYKPIFDPLGIATLDLQAAQALRAMKAGNDDVPSTPSKIHSKQPADMGNVQYGSGSSTALEAFSSIVPRDKSFDIETFLGTIHGNSSMNELDSGQHNVLYTYTFKWE